MIHFTKLFLRCGRVQAPNILAVLIATVSFGLIALDFQSHPATARGVESILPGPSLPLGEVLTKTTNEAEVTPAASQQNASGRMALLMNVLLLEKAAAVLERLPGYTATFSKQELVADELSDQQVMQLKVRHEPFSVYMKWTVGHKGRELLYVDGENKGRMLVKLGGWKSRLPALKLDPTGSMAMKESRYPITKAGLLKLIHESLAIRQADLKKSEGVRCQMIEEQVFAGRPCFAFVVEYASSSVSKNYRKAEMLIDRELGVPVLVRNYTWPASSATTDPKTLDESTLVEFYTYRDIKFQKEIARGEFDQENKAYRF